MAKHFSIATAVALLLIGQAPSLRAQDIELGIDGAITFRQTDPSIRLVDLPLSLFRFGFFISPEVSLEPAFSVHSQTVRGESVRYYTMEFGALWHFDTTPTAKQLYLRPMVTVDGVSADEGGDSRTALGVGLGVKIPMVTKLAARFEANYRRYLSSGDDDGFNQIGLLFGLSFFP
jgi:hypothetical protein